MWLDLTHYSDSAGYADDPPRTIWKYRDWVIKALNANKPFDSFTIEQIAGDLLPSPTEDQLIATAFHRNTMTNNEGGTNDEEFRNVAVVDRVNTTLAVWMGTSMGCAQCHTHKYDPITQEEYFRFFAFLNNTEDADRRDEARVIANRYWEQVFGTGIVRTSEEFGTQGELPSHPELLDWLATELVRQKWDLKAFLKLLVTSATYRQSSAVTAALLEHDPDNRLLARGPRFRLPAEVLHDQALFVGGLLSNKMYGPSVRPPRPASGLAAAFGSSIDWKTSGGEDRHRRALYTEWRRTNPYPSA